MKSTSKRVKALLGGGVILLLGFMLVGHAAAQTVTLVSDDPKLTNPGPITTDGVNLYVGEETFALGDPAGNIILSVPIGGGAATTLYASATPCCVVSLTLIGTDVFWIDPNGDPDATAIFRGSTSGGPVTKIYSGFATGQPIVDGSDITTDGVELYTADYVQGRVHRVDPTGVTYPPLTGITQLGPNRYGGFFDREHRNLIDEDAGVLYIADNGNASFGDTPPRVQLIPSTGGAFTTLFLGPTFTSRAWGGVTVGNNTIYLTEGNTILQMPVTGGTPTLLVSDPQFKTLQGITFFNNALYVADNGDVGATPGPGKIYKVALDVFGPVTTAPETSAPEVNGDEVVLNGTESNDPNNTTVFDNVAITVETPPEIMCNSPDTIVPPDAPISFTATATDIYGSVVSATITGVGCYKTTKKGKEIEKTESCVVSINNDTVTISDSGGVGDHITWIVTAGNYNDTCEVVVVNPGKGKGQSKIRGH